MGGGSCLLLTVWKKRERQTDFAANSHGGAVGPLLLPRPGERERERLENLLLRGTDRSEPKVEALLTPSWGWLT